MSNANALVVALVALVLYLIQLDYYINIILYNIIIL